MARLRRTRHPRGRRLAAHRRPPLLRAGSLGLLGLLITALLTALLPTAASAADPVPSPAQIKQQQQQAARLAGQANSDAQTLATQQSKLATLAAQANAALQQLVLARRKTAAAQAAVTRARQALEQAQATSARMRQALGNYAASAYRSEGASAGVAAVDAMLRANSPAELSFTHQVLATVGQKRGRLLDDAKAAAAALKVAEQHAQQAVSEARTAEQQEAGAKAKADQLVAAQQQIVTAQAQTAQGSQAAAAHAKQVAANMAKARQVWLKKQAEAAAARARAIAAHHVVLGAGTCSLTSAAGYPNGQIPMAALCPLWGAPGHLLVYAAAGAFNQMSQAYAATFGRPICVTDSYRSLAMQIDVHQRKPNMTAIPGTSNHGWGKAVDLCDGVNDFGTVTYDWMKANAARFGWFHPSWAEPGTSRPEPWHWEYSG